MPHGKPLVITALLASLCAHLTAEVAALSPEEQRECLNHLLPLPHRISMGRKVVLKPEEVSIRLREGASDVEKNARSVIVDLLKERLGRTPTGERFQIVMGVVGGDGGVAGVEDAVRLRSLRNSDQAYLIRPVGSDKLVVAALTGQGVYYGARTLSQLLAPSPDDQVLTIPLVDVEDWPDLAERGLWNGSGQDLVPWLAPLKINYVTYMVPLRFDKETGKGTVSIEADKFVRARLHGVNCNAKVRHLNFILPELSVYAKYPELSGKGEGAIPVRNPRHSYLKIPLRAPCAHQARLAPLIAEWLGDLAAKGVEHIEAWTTEFHAQCECDDCRREGQFFLEIKAVCDAWRQVRGQYPNAKLRINNSFRLPDEEMRKALLQIPAEVKIGRACFLRRQRHEPRDLFLDPQFDALASGGRWIGCYSLPFMKVLKFQALIYRDLIASLIEREWRGGYILLNTNGAEFNWKANRWNIAALAEWSWNNRGRDVREFALAYATINGYRHPERFAAWAEAVAPIEHDLAGSVMPFLGSSWLRGIKRIVKDRSLGPHGKLGYGYFRHFPALASFDEKIASCQRAIALAQKLDESEPLIEAKLCLHAIRGARAVHQLLSCLMQKPPDKRGLRDGLKTIRGLAKERGELCDLRQALYEPKLHPYFMVEARKAGGKNLLPDFANWLESELEPLLK